MDTTENMTGGASYNKDTYIGYLKLKNGGMKVIPGDVDNQIIQKVNFGKSKLDLLKKYKLYKFKDNPTLF